MRGVTDPRYRRELSGGARPVEGLKGRECGLAEEDPHSASQIMGHRGICGVRLRQNMSH